ncbi:MAG: hypothetical protein WC789_01335 [Lentisphaeria bacterium]|jgi:hypothetical protein
MLKPPLRRLLLAAAWLLLLLPATAPSLHAQDRAAAEIRVRLLHATTGGDAPGDHAELADLLPVLRANLKADAFRLLAARDVTPTAGQRVALGSGLVLTFTEATPDGLCSVILERQQKAILTTRVRLRPGKPVILGGIPHPAGGSLLVVLSTR